MEGKRQPHVIDDEGHSAPVDLSTRYLGNLDGHGESNPSSIYPTSHYLLCMPRSEKKTSGS